MTAAPTLISHYTTGYRKGTPITYVKDIGTVIDTVSASTSVLTLAADTDRTNHYLIARVAVDNSGTSGAAPGLTITDTGGNTWTVGAAANRTPGSASNDGTSCYIAYAKITTLLVATNTITFTWGAGSPTAKAIVVEEWAGIHLTTPTSVAQTTTTGASTTPSITRTSSVTGDVAYGCLAVECGIADGYTESTGTPNPNQRWNSLTRTGIGTTTSGQTVAGAYVTADSTSTVCTWDPTIGTSRDWAQVELVFKSIDPAVNSKESPDFAVLAGDVLVAACMTESYNSSNSAETRGDMRSISGGSLTWTLQQQQAAGVATESVAAIYTAIVDSNKTMSCIGIINQDYGIASYGFDVYVFRGSGGIGASNKGTQGTSGSSAPSVSVTTTGANSALVVCNSDWLTTDGSSRAWRTPSGTTAITEEVYYQDTSLNATCTFYGGYHSDSGSTGSKTVGLTTPSQRWSLAVVEVFGTTQTTFEHDSGANVGVWLPIVGEVNYGAGGS